MTRQKLKKIANQYNLIAIYAFGSRAADLAARVREGFSYGRHSGSDLDIGVQLAEHHMLSAREKVQLTIDLEDLFQEKRVDLLVINEVEPFWHLKLFAENSFFVMILMPRPNMSSLS